MISPVQLSYIFSLLKYKNFQRAAEACHVTQPTLSMQLKKAEDILGYSIINRDTNPISLTEVGKKLLPYLSSIQTAYDELEIQVQKLKGTYKSEIRIGIIPTISNYLIPELYAKWQTQIGDVHLDISELTSEKLIDALKNKTIDFGIMAGPILDKTIEQQVLYNEEILIYSTQIKEKEIDLDVLQNEHPWLLSQGNCLRTQMISFCNLDQNNKTEWNYEGGNLHLLTKMVEQEGGYTLIPKYYVPQLNIEEKHIKKISNHTPIRQIVGLHLSRNTKKEDIKKIMCIIQHNKNEGIPNKKNIEILPWKA
ncbi:LysR family transcriptional regulator [Brumimicrobium aurantiacum]|uniref:LysR family transcriptional regulator n=1 Tax=Brumimicrobium aurantiacum TaxID=1737063 RepID=A0A3E1EWF6_9FLAO|nr:LysR substrate-binding domain-containing protein [Brumimicrobium aurantiacum]RFC53877.1 LysR family transcriptional regulator [Brumimicrobium aurantiacum]